MARELVYNARLVAREDLNPDLAILHVRPDVPLTTGAAPAFVPGQYLAIGLNNAAQPALGGVRRSMSIASAPEERDALQFYIRLVHEPTSANPLTPLLWELEVGAPMFITRRPVGKLTIPATLGEGDGRLLVAVAAGTGLAPFVSMVRSAMLRDPGVDLGRFVILHGVSYPRDLGYRSELEGYARTNGLHYLPTVSRPEQAPGWTGAVGRVEDFFLDERIGALESAIGLEPDQLGPRRAGLLICGLEGTIGATLARSLGRGFVPEQRRIRATLGIGEEHRASLWWEQYDASPVVDPDDVAQIGELRARFDSARDRG